MEFKKEAIKGDKLFDIDFPKNPGEKFPYEYPFNLDFNIKKSVVKDKFKGPAVYAIEFEGNVIYIGKYRPEDKRLISTRWVKHIMTFTNRGYRVGGSALKKIVKGESEYSKFNHKFLINIKDYFSESDRNDLNAKRFEDTNTVTSFNRLKFANFLVANDKIEVSKNKIDISNFTFNCFTLSGSKDDLRKRRDMVSIIEKILLCKYKPKCNKEYIDKAPGIKLADVQSDLKKSLNGLLLVLSQ